MAKRWHLLLCLLACPAASGAPKPKQKVDFNDSRIEGERSGPQMGYVVERPPAKFRCDITRMSVAQYEACFTDQLADLCGVQVIERDRQELVRRESGIVPGAKARTVGSAHPYSLELANGTLFLQEVSEIKDWGQRRPLLRDVSPPLTAFDDFLSTRSSFVLGDRASKRVFVFAKASAGTSAPAFRKLDVAEPTHTLLGVVGESYLVATARDVLLIGLDGKSGKRLRVPLDRYTADPAPDLTGHFLLTSSAPTGRIYIVDPSGKASGSFEKEAGYTYRLLPNGLVASMNPTDGSIRIRDRVGRVLSRTRLGRPVLQFGVFRQGKQADLFFVTADGMGVLYGDGFEKAFLSMDGRYARVVEAENNLLGVLFSSPSQDDPRRLVERRLDYFTLRPTSSKTSKLVEGVCPQAIRLAERALKLRPSLRATMKDGRFQMLR